MSDSNGNNNVVIVGAGLAGSLMAIYLARRGYRVDVYERRPDCRTEAGKRCRSINMTLAERGLRALDEVGILQQVLDLTVTVKGRMVHELSGPVKFQPYGKNEKEVIHAVMRKDLNICLMNHAEGFPNLKIHFRQQCVGIDKQARRICFSDNQSGESYFVEPAFIIGADGTFSTTRQQLHRGERANYDQEFLERGYKELTIDPVPGGGWQLPRHALHVWPRGSCMLMCIANRDGSFTCTCVLPFEGELSFESLNTEKAVREFLFGNFPDLMPLMPNAVENFMRNPPSEFITTRTNVWHYKDFCVLLGDSCHTVVPFYGQGMNAAFEDCSILDQCIEQHRDDLETAFSKFQRLRKRNTDALARLSVENFIELRDKVRSRKLIARKKVDHFLADLLPGTWVPLYTLISHSTIPYADAIERAKKQNRVARYLGVDLLLWLLTAALVSRDGFNKFKLAFASFSKQPVEVSQLKQSKLIRNSQFTTER
jgi:kynurenine 3-monooxygenase